MPRGKPLGQSPYFRQSAPEIGWLSRVCGSLAFADLVAGGQLEEISGGLGTVDIGHSEALVPGPRVAVLAHDHHLQVGGVPGFAGDLDRAVVAYGAHLDRGDVACAFGVDAFHHLFTERLDRKSVV